MGGGKGAFFPKKGVTLFPPATDFREKKFSASSIRIVSYCKYDMYFDKYDMYSIVGQNIHTLNILLHLHTYEFNSTKKRTEKDLV